MNGDRRKRLLLTLLAALMLVLLCESIGVACPTCKEGMAGDPHRADLVRGYFWSILFMMSMPFLILAGLGSYFYFEIRRARKRAGRPSAAGSTRQLRPTTQAVGG